MSDLGIQAIPQVFVDMLEAYAGRNVKHVDLSGNEWNGLQMRPLLSSIACEREKSRFCNLASIDLSDNNLEAVPSTLLDEKVAFPSLSYIDISKNMVTDLGAVLIRRMLDSDDFRVILERNPVVTIAAISTSIGNKSFDEFIVWADTLVNMSRISFNIANCDMGGRIVSNTLLKMPNLEAFALVSNPLVGTLPSQVGLLTQLTRLSLKSNNFAASIPSQLGLLTKLNWMDLSNEMPS